MLSLDELLHPITPEQFRADYEDRKPLHIPAAEGGRKRDLLTWDAFNYLLGQGGAWTAQNLRLMRDHIAIPPDQFCQVRQTSAGPVVRPVAGKVELFLSTGASLVANEIHNLHPPLTDLAAMLGDAFAAGIGANAYCSFEGVRAFGTHYDNHDVFAIHTEGEKLWNLYENRAENPTDIPADTMETRRRFEQMRGPLMTQVLMKPGDVLYLPRGWYHDALATRGASLHVTFSVNPLYGRIMLSLLDNAAMQNPAFRAWLAPASRDGGQALQTQLTELGQLLAAISATPAFRDEVAMAQQRIVPRTSAFGLPRLKPVTLFQTTGRAFPPASTALRVAYDWAIAERKFALEDMVAQFDFISEADIRSGVAAAEVAGAVQRI